MEINNDNTARRVFPCGRGRNRQPGEHSRSQTFNFFKDAPLLSLLSLLSYSRPDLGRTKIRFCFPKKTETLQTVVERLAAYKPYWI